LPSPSRGEGIIAGSSPLRGEGWERVKCQYYFETVINSVNYHDLVGCFHKNKKDEKGLKRYQVCLL
jgi:hypothetical protein